MSNKLQVVRIIDRQAGRQTSRKVEREKEREWKGKNDCHLRRSTKRPQRASECSSTGRCCDRSGRAGKEAKHKRGEAGCRLSVDQRRPKQLLSIDSVGFRAQLMSSPELMERSVTLGITMDRLFPSCSLSHSILATLLIEFVAFDIMPVAAQ